MGFIITKEELPRTHIGKLKRHEVRDKYLDELLGIKPKTQQAEEVSEADREILTSPTYCTISTVIEKQLNLPVHLNDHLGIDLGFDSLSRIELIATLEKQFNLEIPVPLMTKVSTVKELVFTLDQLTTKQTPITTATIQTLDKAVIWQDILKTDPGKIITDKIDLTPSWFAKTANIIFYGGLYIIAKLMWRIKIYGSGNLPQNSPFILCPNHTSYLDALLIGVSLPRRLQLNIFFLGDNTYFAVPIVRNLVKIGKIIPIDPTTHLIDAIRSCAYVLRHDKIICIFPEGGRSPDGVVRTFKKGIGILAHELDIPLVPVYIDGAFNALPRGKFFPNLNRIRVTFGKTYSPKQLKEKGMCLGAKDNYEAIALGIQNEVSNLAKVVII
jgi:long-chain acyl-CoA synthetase